MTPGTRNYAALKAKLTQSCADLSVEQQINYFEKTLHRLLQRIEPTLGPIVLTAILERIFYDSSQLLPFIATLKVDFSNPQAVDFSALKTMAAGLNSQELTTGVITVLTALFTIIDRLTGEILAPAMYAQLLAQSSTDPQ